LEVPPSLPRFATDSASPSRTIANPTPLRVLGKRLEPPPALVKPERDPTQILTAHEAAGSLYLLLLPTWIVGSLWLSRARENAVLIAPDRVRRSAVWAWLGWVVPIV
jgi:Domain of unknown function (DUF4328)